MRNALAIVVGSALSFVAVAGCSSSGGSGGGGGGGTITTANNGGSVSLIITTGFTLGSVAFIKTSTPDTGFSLNYTDGHCVRASTATPPTVTYADAGASLTFTSGSKMEVASKVGSQYQFGVTSSLGPGATWSISAAGGTDIPAGQVGTVRVPSLHTGVTLPSITSGSPATVTWTAGTADGMEIIVGNGPGASLCFAPDNGSFTIPAGVTTSAGTGASVVLVGDAWGHFTFGNGRDVLTDGVAEP